MLFRCYQFGQVKLLALEKAKIVASGTHWTPLCIRIVRRGVIRKHKLEVFRSELLRSVQRFYKFALRYIQLTGRIDIKD